MAVEAASDEPGSFETVEQRKPLAAPPDGITAGTLPALYQLV
jgi:hypothetical protein